VLLTFVLALSFIVGFMFREFFEAKKKFDSIDYLDKETEKFLTRFEQIDEKIKHLINKQINNIELESKVESLNNRIVLLTMKK
jgi:hypothetical protein